LNATASNGGGYQNDGTKPAHTGGHVIGVGVFLRAGLFCVWVNLGVFLVVFRSVCMMRFHTDSLMRNLDDFVSPLKDETIDNIGIDKAKELLVHYRAAFGGIVGIIEDDYINNNADLKPETPIIIQKIFDIAMENQ
jgi:hypothetical protein